jgi:phage repressor protein C with HTH and peptisase S24 domain
MQHVHHVNMTRVYTFRDDVRMPESMHDRLRRARTEAGFSSARAAALRFGWKPSTYAAHENGQNRFDETVAREYARRFKVSPGWLLGLETPPPPAPARLVPVVGYVGAGAEVHLVDDHAKGAGLDEVPAPPSVSRDCVAVKIRGDSMEPRFFEGEILFYDKVYSTPEQLRALIRRECVITLEDGRVFVKRLLAGSRTSTWTLWSYNAEPITDARIKWAAPVDWRYSG